MSTTLDWSLAGQEVILHGDKALYYPAESTLLVADTHFGKGAHFRRAGLALPTGDSLRDLQRLARLVEQFAAQRLLILGDVFHHRPTPDEPFLAALAQWQRERPGLIVEAVIGNHDRHALGGALELTIRWHDQLDLGPFRLRHEPQLISGRHVLAGHVHPAYSLRVGRERLRAPVFWLQPDISVLPSFGALTGGWEVDLAAQDELVLSIEGELFALPAQEGKR
jgi:uncharacterized protein